MKILKTMLVVLMQSCRVKNCSSYDRLDYISLNYSQKIMQRKLTLVLECYADKHCLRGRKTAFTEYDEAAWYILIGVLI
jgi:hypothetical protein